MPKSCEWKLLPNFISTSAMGYAMKPAPRMGMCCYTRRSCTRSSCDEIKFPAKAKHWMLHARIIMQIVLHSPKASVISHCGASYSSSSLNHSDTRIFEHPEANKLRYEACTPMKGAAACSLNLSKAQKWPLLEMARCPL